MESTFVSFTRDSWFPATCGEPAADLITFAVKSKSHIGRFGKVAFTVVASSGNRGKAGVGVFV